MHDGMSGHVLHVVHSVTVAELRDAQVLCYVKLEVRPNKYT